MNLTLSLCLFGCLVALIKCKPILENLPERLSLSENEKNDFVFYSSTDFLQSEPIFLTFDPPSDHSDPGRIEAYLSSRFSDINSTHFDIKCSIKSFDICAYEVPSSQKMNSNVLFIQLECFSPKCEYAVRLTHKQEIQLQYFKPERFLFQRTSLEQFNVTVPDKNVFARIVIVIRYVFVPKGSEDLLGEHHSVVLSRGGGKTYKFADQQIVVFESNQVDLCYRCNITASVISALNSIVEIQALLYQNETRLIVNKFYTDFVFLGKDNRYLIQLENEIVDPQNFSLSIHFNSLTGGKKTLFLDIDKMPEKLADFRWKTELLNSFYEEADITISKDELNRMGFIGKKYFIVVEGDAPGVFGLLVNTNTDRTPLPLYLGTSQSGLISNNEIINFEVKLWRSAVPEDLVFSATIVTGHLNLYVRKCDRYEACEAITKKDVEEKRRIDLSSEFEGVSSLEFRHDCQENICFYVLAVMGKSLTASRAVKFDVILKNTETFVNLIENSCYESQINSHEFEQFKLFVENLEDEIISVNFFINSDLQFVVGKETLCSLDSKDCIQKIGTLFEPATFESQEFEPHIQLNGTYYILIFGVKSAEYIFLPEVRRKSSSKAFVQLMEGKFLAYFISISKKVAFFEFIVDSEEETSVEINLQSNEVNHLTIYLQNDGTVPSSENFLLSSSNNHLSSSHNSKGEVIYKVAVESKNYLYSYKNNKIDFSIMYSTSRTLQHLESNKPFYDHIKPHTHKNFLFYLDLNNTFIFVSKHILNPPGADELFLLTFSMFFTESNIHNLYPNITTKSSTIRLEQGQLMSLCQSKYSRDSIYRCAFYITLSNENEYEVYYTLNVRASEASVQIRQGKELAIRFHAEESSVRLYFIPSKRVEYFEIFAYSLHFNFNVYVRILNNNQSLTPDSWDYPNEKSHDLQFLDKRRVSFLLKSALINDCWPRCIILFNLTLSSEVKSEEERLVNIILTNELMEINDNHMVHFNSMQKTYKYFIYDLSVLLQRRFSISVDLTNILGVSELYLMITEGSAQMFPTAEFYDFFSIDGHFILSFNEISDKLPKNPNQTTQNFLLIGVLCTNPVCENGLVARMVDSSEVSIRKVLGGHPYEFYLSKKAVQVFEYFHYSDKAFQIKINKEFGNGKFSAIPCFAKSLGDCLIPRNSLAFHTLRAESIKINNSNDYCVNCYYEILISTNETNSNLKGTLNIVLEDEDLILTDGHAFFDFVEEEKENHYVCPAPSSEELEIVLTAFTNQPELYASRRKQPHRSKYEFKAIGHHGPVSSLVIDPDPKDILSEEIYIIVYGKTESKYSIKCRFKSSFSVLHAGLMEFAELKPLGSHKYAFYSNEEHIFQNSPRFSLYYMYAKNIREGLKVAIQAKNLDTHHGETLINQNWALSENQTAYSFHALGYDLNNMSLLYEITVTNSFPSPINYSVSIETRHLNLLPFDSILHFPVAPDTWKYYEAFIPGKGLFALDLIECLGNIEIYTTDSYENLLKHRFEEEVKTVAWQDNLKVFRVSQGKFYFALHRPEYLRNQSLSQESFVQLSTHFYDSYDEIPQFRFVVGNEGSIEWFHNPNGETIIMFTGLVCQNDCEPEQLKLLSVSYQVIASENSNLMDGAGKCGLVSVRDLRFSKDQFVFRKINGMGITNESKLITAELQLDKDQNYYVTVIAQIYGIEGELPVLFYYRNSQIGKFTVQRQKIYGIVLAVLCLIAFLAFCGCYYYGVYAKLKRKLRYEIKEVQNGSSITILNTSIEMKSDKLYQDLVEQLN